MVTGAARILLVDDEPRTCQMLQRILACEGYAVDAAHDGRAALRQAARQRYDFIVLDYRMPKMDGVELFRRIRRRLPDVVGVMLTGYAAAEMDYRVIDAGISRVLGKPVDLDELLAVLNQCLPEPAEG